MRVRVRVRAKVRVRVRVRVVDLQVVAVHGHVGGLHPLRPGQGEGGWG